MNQFMRRRNQIEFFVRFKADRSLKFVQYDPFVYGVDFTVDNGICHQKTEIVSNT